MKNKLSTKQGFTIIEVVLVLAIAGLIFLMVFVAFPALQSNQRDTQRRQDYADLGAAVITSVTNSNGSFNSSSISGIKIGNDGKDPENKSYTITVVTAAGTINKPTGSQVYVIQKGKCNGDTGSFDSSKTEKDFAIYGALSNNGTYCREFKY